MAQRMQDPLAGLGLSQEGGANGRSSSPQANDLISTSESSTNAASWPRTKVYEKNGVVVHFDFSKPAAQPSVTDITASYSTTASSPVSKFSLQARLGGCLCLAVQPSLALLAE